MKRKTKVGGFLPAIELLSERPEGGGDLIAKCGACGLHKKCISPKLEVTGLGRKSILVVAEFPSRGDDEAGKLFAGSSGRLLSRLFEPLGLDWRRDCWLTSAVICYPGSIPDEKKVAYCWPNLRLALRRLRPRYVIPMGRLAMLPILNATWRDDVGPQERWVGWRIPYHDWGWSTWILPTWNHALLLEQECHPIIRLQVASHLAAIPSLGKPPRLEPECEILWDRLDIRKMLLSGVEDSAPFAFDFEANTILPEHPGAIIHCVGISWGPGRTYAFPWSEELREPFAMLLANRAPKFGANIKFEDRWSRLHVGRVRNWQHCTMQTAHVLDNRQQITGLKFQSFVRYGVSYGHQEKSFMDRGSDGLNTLLRDVGIKRLMEYCGKDAFMTWILAHDQIAELAQ